MDRSRLQLWFTFASVVLIVGGAAYLFSTHVSVSAARHAPAAPVKAAPVSSSVSEAKLVVGDVTRVTIANVNVSLPVKSGEYDDTLKTWSLDDTHAFFMSGSATPVVYGHAIPEVFGPLSSVGVDDVLKLETSRGVLSFRFVGDEFVAPDNTDILSRYLPNTVLLMTCDGLFSEQRRVLHFEYVPEV